MDHLGRPIEPQPLVTRKISPRGARAIPQIRKIIGVPDNIEGEAETQAGVR